MDLDVVTLAGAVERVLSWCRSGQRHVVVTPNLDHAVALRGSAALRHAYAQAGLALADGMPLVWASRIGGPALPERVAGADLILPICRGAAAEGFSVFLLGSTFATLAKAARRLSAVCPGLRIAGIYAPPHDRSFNAREDDRIVDAIAAAQADIVFVAFGMPKQELWAARNIARLPSHAVLCIGAGLDFIAGAVPRAPLTMQRSGLEWLWRLCGAPGRLAPRYARDVAWLPRLLLEQLAAVVRNGA